MKVSVDVYTKDVDAALEAFKLSIDSGVMNVELSYYFCNEWFFILFLESVEHSSPVISHLDNGPFTMGTP